MSVQSKKKKTTFLDLNDKKNKGEKIIFLTAYDYPTAALEEEAGVDAILVGDSLGMCVYGYESTLPVTMDMMINHSQAVRRGAPGSLVVADMPYMSYQVSVEQAITNAGRFMQEAGVDGIKLEGGFAVCDKIEAVSKAGIPVVGHLGLTPQSVSMLGGYKAQGRSFESALSLIEEAKALESAGCVCIVLEAVPAEVAEIVTKRAPIPIIGIGAGPECDGQVLVVNDLLGLFGEHLPKFVKRYAHIEKEIKKALIEYKEDVKNKIFPGSEHCYPINADELDKLKKALSLL